VRKLRKLSGRAFGQGRKSAETISLDELSASTESHATTGMRCFACSPNQPSSSLDIWNMWEPGRRITGRQEGRGMADYKGFEVEWKFEPCTVDPPDDERDSVLRAADVLVDMGRAGFQSVENFSEWACLLSFCNLGEVRPATRERDCPPSPILRLRLPTVQDAGFPCRLYLSSRTRRHPSPFERTGSSFWNRRKREPRRSQARTRTEMGPRREKEPS